MTIIYFNDEDDDDNPEQDFKRLLVRDVGEQSEIDYKLSKKTLA